MENPFHLKSIKIHNLFGGRDIFWPLFDDVNVVSGPNGSGKSTILRLVYQLLSTGNIAESRLVNLADSVCVEFAGGYTIQWDRNDDSHCIVLSPEKNVVTFESIKELLEVRYVNSFEMIAKEVLNLRKEGDNGITTLDLFIREEINTRNAVFANTFEKLFEGISHNQTLQQLAEQNPDIANYLDFYSRLHVFMSSYKVLLDNRIRFINVDNKDFDYTGLSSGEKQVLLLLLMAFNTQRNSCVFFMDEPDLALHIRWKQLLIRELKSINPKMQIVLSTHSPSVIEGWYDKVIEISQMTTILQKQ